MNEATADFLERVVPEVNHLFWTPVFVNKGVLDLGLSCREHAWAAVMLLRDIEVDCMVAHGKLQYLFPPTERDGLPSAVDIRAHTFVRLVRYGYLDVSIKPSVKVQSNILLEFPKLHYSALLPATWGDLEIAEMGKPLRPVDRNVVQPKPLAQYKVERLEQPGRTMNDDPCLWINSPLTDELKLRYGPAAYGRALAHLRSFMRKESRSLQGMKRREAWDHLCGPAPS